MAHRHITNDQKIPILFNDAQDLHDSGCCCEQLHLPLVAITRSLG